MSHRQLLPRDVPVQLINADGKADSDDVYLAASPTALTDGYRSLVVSRRINDQCYALVRQGRLAVYPSSYGQEACQVAAVSVLDDGDWLFPTYRDSVSLMLRGIAPADALTLLRGDWHCGYNPHEFRVAPQSTPLATQLIHAVGFAHAAVLKGEPTVVMALCGDGATSEGDFHEAMNFAAVFHLPVVFFVQNNRFAISVPFSKQSAAESLAHKAAGYGMPGEQVDGNDLAALLAVLGIAVDRARSGGGPTLVEAHTYRMQAHTNADDDTRYRDSGEVQAWAARDPLVRLRKYLRGKNALDDAEETAFAAEADEIATTLRDALNTDVQPDAGELFRHVYATSTPQLDEQWASLQGELERSEDGAKS
ncbi:pyruvate dehydrogenase (acetyl-transferring) E1 component subunit alpha [Salinibacterium sp. TMP30]|uniref:pyruvate dehydrogenase (acetyl-transferring) E1 component subunit alpha n=1 Tax=Salinibacterium sp. TMP30 TaxID=3138237 RepID=UPI0031387BE3